jgi:hypothetical protein
MGSLNITMLDDRLGELESCRSDVCHSYRPMPSLFAK